MLLFLTKLIFADPILGNCKDGDYGTIYETLPYTTYQIGTKTPACYKIPYNYGIYLNSESKLPAKTYHGTNQFSTEHSVDDLLVATCGLDEGGSNQNWCYYEIYADSDNSLVDIYPIRYNDNNVYTTTLVVKNEYENTIKYEKKPDSQLNYDMFYIINPNSATVTIQENSKVIPINGDVDTFKNTNLISGLVGIQPKDEYENNSFYLLPFTVKGNSGPRRFKEIVTVLKPFTIYKPEYSMPGWVIAIIVIAVVAVVAIIGFCIYFFVCRKKKN